MSERKIGRCIPLLVALALGVAGCGDGTSPRASRVPRPAPWDRVTPEVLLGEPWRPGHLEQFSVQCRVAGPAGPAGLLLGLDVPEPALPRVTVTYYRGDEELAREPEPQLTRFC